MVEAEVREVNREGEAVEEGEAGAEGGVVRKVLEGGAAVTTSARRTQGVESGGLFDAQCCE